MPELPDVTLYLEALEARIVGETLTAAAVRSPSLLRTYDPPLAAVVGRVVRGVRRIGKRVVLELEGDHFLVIHLMIAGRFHWRKAGVKPTRKVDLASFEFPSGTLLLTEASTKKRATLHVVKNAGDLVRFERGGVDLLTASRDAVKQALTLENHTLKRSLTDPRLFDGIGNAYSDEILHAARMSPLTWSTRLTEEEVDHLLRIGKETLELWIRRLRDDLAGAFPEKVTAFRPEMAVHGKFGRPCPVCATKVQRILHADNETNYCPRCQTEGKLLADRALSQLLKKDWPRTIEDLEALQERQKSGRK